MLKIGKAILAFGDGDNGQVDLQEIRKIRYQVKRGFLLLKFPPPRISESILSELDAWNLRFIEHMWFYLCEMTEWLTNGKTYKLRLCEPRYITIAVFSAESFSWKLDLIQKKAFLQTAEIERLQAAFCSLQTLSYRWVFLEISKN